VAGTHVALIRGINVGRAKRVAMADLRALFADLGCQDVRTVLNSGNVVFGAGRASGHRLAARVQDEMASRLGVSARVLVVTRAAYLTAVDEFPLGRVASDPTRLLVAFCTDAAQLGKLKALARTDWSPEAVAVGSVAAYLWCAGGILDSAALKAAGRALGDSMTARNWATVTKIKDVLTATREGEEASR
jgi:uncharacterized protein (DUF1697 family)